MSLKLVTALTIDLDDTLWPVGPTLAAAEVALAAWLRQNAPATAAGVGEHGMLVLRAQVAAERPDWAHDLTAVRLETIRRALRRHGDDPSLAEPAFEAFFEVRHQVTPYADVRPALARLAHRFRIVALSNGNAQIHRVGLGEFFAGAVSARAHGAAKPQASIFHAACESVGAPPARVLHLGDDPLRDVDGALAAGLQAAWVMRGDCAYADAPPREQAHRFSDLLEAASALGC